MIKPTNSIEEHENYCDLLRIWSNPEDVLCSCDKEPQERLLGKQFQRLDKLFGKDKK